MATFRISVNPCLLTVISSVQYIVKRNILTNQSQRGSFSTLSTSPRDHTPGSPSIPPHSVAPSPYNHPPASIPNPSEPAPLPPSSPDGTTAKLPPHSLDRK